MLGPLRADRQLRNGRWRMPEPGVRYARGATGVWHILVSADGTRLSLCGRGTAARTRSRRRGRMCQLCVRRFCRDASPAARACRKKHADQLTARVRTLLADHVPAQLREWPPAVAITGPAADRLGSLVLSWELTGEPGLVRQIDGAWKDLNRAWLYVEARYGADA